MASLGKYLKRYWYLATAAVIFLVIESFGDLLQPTIMARIIDQGVANHDLARVWQLGGMMLAVTGMGAIGAIGRNVFSSNASQRIGADLRSDLFKKINSLPIASLNEFETATLITRLTNDVTIIQEFVHRLMRIFIRAPILAVGSVVMAAFLNLQMSVVFFAVIPVVSVIIVLNLRVGIPFFTKVQVAFDEVNSVMREYLAGIRVVKAFNRAVYEGKRFAAANARLASITETTQRIMSIFSPLTALVVNFGIVAIFWFGGLAVSGGLIEVGVIMAYINYMTQVQQSLRMISRIFSGFVGAKASLDRAEEIFTTESKMFISSQPVPMTQSGGRIDFENVSFAYGDTSELVLQDVSFSCLPGQTIGIIGSTGSGKTTLVNLIPRFFDPVSGVIKLDGTDIRQLDLAALRGRIALVPQKTLLFTGTIADNIRWGKEDATQEEIEAAARVAQAHGFIERSPHRYGAMLGQAGVNLSGGQKQRLALARALIRKPEILILDDSTSAIDFRTEAKIRTSLREYSQNLTSIIIAQRITSVLGADQIVVLDQGKLVGLGTHEQLVNSCQVYQDIYNSQVGVGEAG